MQFKWHPDEPPPELESHSKAKLTVLRSYLRAYFRRLNVNPQRDTFRLDLIDGFAGGGLFRDGAEVVPGTPVIMLEEAADAHTVLNQGRTKPLHVDCQFYFVDKEPAHTDHLRKALGERGYDLDHGNIVVRTGRFEDEVERILRSVHQRQPRAGRAIFLLDQTGFSQVELALVARILSELPASEVILTFAADALLNYLADTPSIIKPLERLGFTENRIRDLLEDFHGHEGKALVQRTLRDDIRSATGATYDTPFFIRPRESRRALWFLHLSRHPTARDVMIQQHWEARNAFEHYGRGDFTMLGWDALSDSGTLPLFHFDELDAKQLHSQLLKSLPHELYAFAADRPVTVETMHHELANRSAARFSDYDAVILRLVREGEFEILSPDGKVRSSSLRRLHPTDRIALPSTLQLPGLPFPSKSVLVLAAASALSNAHRSGGITRTGWPHLPSKARLSTGRSVYEVVSLRHPSSRWPR